MSLAKIGAKIVGGSALAGFGLSLGRDSYKKSKDNFILLLIIIVSTIILLALFYGPRWIFRNYRSTTEVNWNKSVALLLFIISYILSFPIIMFFSSFFIEFVIKPIYPDIESIVFSSYEYIFYIYNYLFGIVFQIFGEELNIKYFDNIHELKSDIVNANLLVVTFYIQHTIIALGIFKGLNDRSRRRLAWQVEKHNLEFLEEHGIEEVGDEKYVDSDGNHFRLENVFQNKIELFEVGRRNKRGYIQLDNEGRFTSWSRLQKKTT